MSKLTLYILREFLIPLFYCLTGFLGIYVLFELFGSFARIIDSGMSFGQCVLYFGGYLSPFFHYLASAAMMLATLYTMWNFCRHSELTAMRASGISLFAIVKPLLIAGVVMGAVVVWVSEWYMPEYGQWAKNIKRDRFDSEKIATQQVFDYANTRDNRVWTVKGGSNADCTELFDVKVVQGLPTGLTKYSVKAEKAAYLDGEWWFFNPEITHFRKAVKSGHTADEECPSPMPELDALTLRSFSEFTETPKDIRIQNCDPKLFSVKDKFRYVETNTDLTESQKDEYRYSAWAQLFAPLSCIVVMLLSIPAGITSGRQSVFEGIIGAVGMFFAFHGVSIGCMVLVGCGLMPPAPAAIVPVAMFLAVGVFFFYNDLKATMMLLGAYTGLFVLYVVIAFLLSAKLGVDTAFSHVIAFPMPVLTAALATLKLRSRV